MGRARAVLERSGPVPVLVVLFWALVLPIIFGGNLTANAGARDEVNFHYPTIWLLAVELPNPDLENIYTATTPGFHLVLSVVARLVSADPEVLELVGALFSLAMVLVAYRLLARYTDRWLAFALTLPLLFSHYVLQSAAWLNTDNAAVLFILLTLGVALELPAGGLAYVRGGLYLFLGVWVRQLALWAAGPFVFAALLAAATLRKSRPVVLAGLALIPALLTLGGFAIAWGQLTPPRFAAQSGASPAAIPFTLAIVGMFGWFFAACAVRVDDLVRGRAPVVAAGVGALLAIAPPTSESTHLQQRTGGGLWKTVDSTPTVADRSLLILVLATAGAVLLVGFWRAAQRAAMTRPALVVLVAIASLALAQAGTVRTYQRYFEPALLVLLALLTTFAGPDRTRTIRAMAVLAAVQLFGVISVVYVKAL
jgi:hypothetical protein